MLTKPSTGQDPVDGRRSRIAALNYDYVAQPKERRACCNLCGNDVLVTITHVDRYGYPAKADACHRCGLVFVNPVMTQSAYGQFYVDVYRPLVSAYHGRKIDAQTMQAEQVDYAAALKVFLAPAVEGKKFRTMLDIGGSTGIVAHELAKSFGLSGTVIDPAPLEIDVARKFGLETITGFVEDYSPGDSTFDIVIMCQTVDHLLDVASTIGKVRQLISPDGYFFVDIVDFRAAYLRVHSIEGAIKIDHPYYLTQSTIQAYLKRAGFAVRRVNYALDHLHIGFLCSPDTAQPEFLPDPQESRDLLAEIRWMQNTRVPA